MWFRDHVYMRFVLAATKGRWFTDKYLASYVGFFLAFGLMGLWHGTQPHYLAYGLYHGAFLSAHEAFARWNKTHQLWGDTPVWRAASVFTTFNLVCFGFLIFSGRIGPTLSFGAGGPRQLEGVEESANCQTVTGWAWDKSRPSTAIRLAIYDNSRFVEQLVADQFRQDLVDAGKGDGEHGFKHPLPARLRDGNPHLIRVKYLLNDEELSNSGIRILCEKDTNSP